MNRNSSHSRLIHLSYAAIMAALVFVLTTYAHLPIPMTNGGYVHLGDVAVMLAGALLPWPYALGAAAVGAGLADLAAGAPLWIPASVVIKALTVLCFTSKKPTIICKRNLLAVLPSAVLCAGGYYLYEALIYSNWIPAAVGIPMNLLQTVIGFVLFLALGYALDKAKFKTKLMEL